MWHQKLAVTLARNYSFENPLMMQFLGARSVEVGDLAVRKSLREKMQCKSFRWYLENIYPESQMPLEYYYLGEVCRKLNYHGSMGHSFVVLKIFLF